MTNKSILAIFDFCDTLIGMQTADRFVYFCYQKNKTISNLINELIRIILRKSRLLFGLRHKKWNLKKLKGLSKIKVENLAKNYVNDILKPNENKNIIEKMLWHKNQGHCVIIVSGGFSVYIDEFAKLYNIDKIIATNLEVIDDKFSGKIDGIDCMGINKVKKLKESINLDEFDLVNSFVYSDSLSDIPLFSLVGNPVVVNFGQNLDWAKIMNYGVIDAK